MSTFYFFDNHLTEHDIKVLRLYLDGVPEREIIKQTLPQGYDRMPIGKTAINKIMQKLRLTLCMPVSKAAAIEHKEQVLKNLSEHLEYRKRLKRFEQREQKRLTKSDFADLSHK